MVERDPPAAIDGLIARMAVTAPETELRMRAVQYPLLRSYLERAAAAGLPASHPLFWEVGPKLVGVQSMTCRSKMETEVRRSRELVTGLRVGGRLVSSFVQVAYSESVNRQLEIEVEVERLPDDPPLRLPEESEHPSESEPSSEDGDQNGK